MNIFIRNLALISAIIIHTIALKAENVSASLDTISFVDNFSSDISRSPRFKEFTLKEDRLNARASIITPEYFSMPDSMKQSIDAAIDVWESLIPTMGQFKMNFIYESVQSGNDIEVDVLYLPSDGIAYPYSLWLTINQSPNTNNKPLAAIIKINSNCNWECGYSSSNNMSQNLTYAMLRSIGIALGFGSSVTEKTTSRGKFITFNTLNYSLFDNLIFSSSGTRLSDIPNIGTRFNHELVSYVQPTNGEIYYAGITDDEYRLYCPTQYEFGKSLIWLDNPGSLMHYDIEPGDKEFSVDELTLELLRQIGWNIPETYIIRIEGEDIDDSGIASAYESHTFHISNPSNKVLSDVNWQFSLPLVNGEYSVEKTASGTTSFSIPAIVNPESYKVNINGDIYGEVLLTATVDGEVLTDRYRVSLELKPKILDVAIVSKQLIESNTFYDIIFTAKYTGANYIQVAAEQEYDTIVLNKIISEPFFAHASFSRLSPFEYTWIDIFVNNKYGSDTYTIEIPPFENERQPYSEISKITFDDIKATEIKVYDVFGIHIATLNSASQLQNLMGNKIYILKLTDSNGNKKTIKYKHL